MPKSLPELAAAMRAIDFTMLTTRGESGALNSRPMSNNRDVEFDGDSWFFTYADTAKVADIRRDPAVALTLQGASGEGGRPGIFLFIEGEAELIDDKARFAEHWQDDLQRWFPQAIDTPGMMLIKARAGRICYWDGEDQGEVRP
jgi:general stress protein 26